MWREIKRRKDGNTDLGLNRGGGDWRSSSEGSRKVVGKGDLEK